MYTDGSGTVAQKPYGYGAVLIANGKEKEISGGGPQGSNNKAELTAVIAALWSLKPQKRPYQVVVHSDSEYVVNAFNKGWINRWSTNGWKNNRGKPTSNRPEWETLLALTEMWHMEVTFQHVRGHSKDNSSPHTIYNTRCDKLANKARRKVEQDVENGLYESEDEISEAAAFDLREFWKGRAQV